MVMIEYKLRSMIRFGKSVVFTLLGILHKSEGLSHAIYNLDEAEIKSIQVELTKIKESVFKIESIIEKREHNDPN